MQIISVSNLKWLNAEHTVVVADVVSDQFPDGIPMGGCETSDTEYGVELWTKAIAGDYGDIAEYIAPTADELRAAMPNMEKWRFEAIVDLNGLRAPIDDAINAFPEPARTISKNKRNFVPEFYRTDPLFVDLALALNMSQERVDELWAAGLAL